MRRVLLLLVPLLALVGIAVASSHGAAGASDPPKVTFKFFQNSSLSGPEQVTAGPDGALWFTNGFAAGGIGRITPNGKITVYPSGDVPDASITAGPDGALWFATST